MAGLNIEFSGVWAGIHEEAHQISRLQLPNETFAESMRLCAVLFPCAECRGHLADYWVRAKRPVSVPDAFDESVHFHNLVNRRLQKPVVQPRSAKRLYNSDKVYLHPHEILGCLFDVLIFVNNFLNSITSSEQLRVYAEMAQHLHAYHFVWPSPNAVIIGDAAHNVPLFQTAMRNAYFATQKEASENAAEIEKSGFTGQFAQLVQAYTRLMRLSAEDLARVTSTSIENTTTLDALKHTDAAPCPSCGSNSGV